MKPMKHLLKIMNQNFDPLISLFPRLLIVASTGPFILECVVLVYTSRKYGIHNGPYVNNNN